MSHTKCFKLYPPGTLGRLFINVSIKAIKTLDPSGSFIDFTDNYVCIKDHREAASIIKGIYEQTRTADYNVFPTVPNDQKPLSRITTNEYNRTNPGSIIEYGIGILEKGGVNRLETTDTAPAVMRIEFYEYPRPGYMGIIKQKLSKHPYNPYKSTNLISLVLAVLGAYISYVTYIGENQSITYLLLREFNSIQEYLITKKIVAKQLSIQQPRITTPLLTLRLALYLMRNNVLFDSSVGELLRLMKGRNRLNPVSREIIDTAGWIKVLRALSDRDVSILEKLVDTVIDAYSTVKNKKKRVAEESSLHPLIELFYYLFQYAQCVEDAKYHALRLIKMIEDNISDPGSREWRGTREIMLKATRNPEVFLESIRTNIVSANNICEDILYV